jgi:two-component system, NarL family, nitrate/nitrite response regulator NarL
MAVSILIVDDHMLVRDGLRRHLEAQPDFTVLGEAVNGRDGVARAEELRPDVVVMDIAMPEMDGIEATRLICQALPQVRVLILSIYDSRDNCLRALRSGASGYLLKESASEEIVAAVRTVVNGGRFFGEGMIDVR